MTWHFRPFFIATAQGVRPANLQDPEDAKAVNEFVRHKERTMKHRRKFTPMNKPLISNEMMSLFAENMRLTQELERKILETPGLREVYMELRYHTQHPDEAS